MNLTFRFPKESDLDILLEHINTVSQEKTFIRYQGAQITRKDEESYLKSTIKAIKENKDVMLVAFEGEKLIGSADVRTSFGAEKHTAEFGIIIKKEYRGKGIGAKLIKATIEKAKTHIKGLEIIHLGVFSNNASAIHLYKKFGFKKYGELPNGIIRKGKHYNQIYMYLNVN